LHKIIAAMATGPCKIHRTAASDSVYLVVGRERVQEFDNKSGDAAFEVADDDIQCSIVNSAQCWYAGTHPEQYRTLGAGDHVFTAFNLVPDGTGEAWQLRYVLVPPAGMTPEQIAAFRQKDLVLGTLLGQEGRAGLVPRLAIDGTPTPGSQVVVLRESCDEYVNVAFKNNLGYLHYRATERRYYWGNVETVDFRRMACFQMHHIEDLHNLDVTVPLQFVKSPTNPHVLTPLPPHEPDPKLYEDRLYPLQQAPPNDPPLTKRPNANEGESTSIGGNITGGGDDSSSGTSSTTSSTTSTTTSTTTTSSTTSSTTMSPWLLILIIVLCLLALVIALALARWSRRRTRKLESQRNKSVRNQ
jgi:hypothetical protein